jgi:hypothetical protein
MYLDQSHKVEIESHTQQLETGHHHIWWEGFVFIKGTLSGDESLRQFSEIARSQDIAAGCRALSGQYSCIVHEKKSAKWFGFIDNDGMSLFVHDTKALSSSFLGLAKRSGLDAGSLSPLALVSFVHSGRMLGDASYLDPIKALGPDQLVEVTASGLEFRPKGLAAIRPAKDSEGDFREIFHSIAQSLRNRKLGVDLSGGTDSRLISVMLKSEGLPFESATVFRPGLPDPPIAMKVAAALGLNHRMEYRTAQDAMKLPEVLDELTRCTDGALDVCTLFRDSFVHERGRKERGVNLAINGIGGELYKAGYWWRPNGWQQEKNETARQTIQRLADNGDTAWYIKPEVATGFYGARFKDTAQRFLSLQVDQLHERFGQTSGPLLADRIFYEFCVSGAYRVFASGRFVERFAIILDRDLVGCGWGVPERTRYFTGLHRKLISSKFPDVAKIETTDVLYRNWLPEVDGFVLERTASAQRRLSHYANEIGKKVGAVKAPTNAPGDPFSDAMYKALRDSERMRENLTALKKAGVLDPKSGIEQIDNRSLGALFSVGEVVRQLEG